MRSAQDEKNLAVIREWLSRTRKSARPRKGWTLDCGMGFQPEAYLVASTTGAGAGCSTWISWNCGSLRRPGGFESLVQQQEAASSARAEAANVQTGRIMGVGFGVIGLKSRPAGQNHLLAGSDVGGLGGCRCAGAARGGGECDGGGDKGDFHGLLRFGESETGTSCAGLGSETNGRSDGCKAKDHPENNPAQDTGWASSLARAAPGSRACSRSRSRVNRAPAPRVPSAAMAAGL